MIDLYTERIMVEQAKEIFESLMKNEVVNEFSYAMMLCIRKLEDWIKHSNCNADEKD